MATAHHRSVPLSKEDSTLATGVSRARPRAGSATHADELHVRRILCTIDFSDFSHGTVAHAVALARVFNAELRALFVFPLALSPKAGVSSATGLDGIDPGVRSVVAQDLTELFRPAGTAGVRVEVCLKAGDPVAEILKAAHEVPADLIVMGTHGRSGVKRWVLGSVADQVLRDAPCPVLTCSPPGHERTASGAKSTAPILCAVDLSDSSRQTLEYALLLARKTAAPLTLLHAVASAGEAVPYGTVEASRVAEARKRLHELVPEEAQARIETVVVTGTPYREILRTADEQNVGLIVVGNRGRHAPGRTLFGSTADHVARGAQCSVLTIPPVAHRTS